MVEREKGPLVLRTILFLGVSLRYPLVGLKGHPKGKTEAIFWGPLKEDTTCCNSAFLK